MKKYMVRCDIEGVTGVVSYEQAEPGKPEYEFGRRMFAGDLSALTAGLGEGGADEVVIYDEHYYGRNIDIGGLPGFATAICGKPPYRADWAGGLDASFSGLILLGFHSKAGTPGGLLPHTYELDIADLRINGVSVGEIGMEAAIAGDFGVPTLLVVGDSAGVNEACALIPGAAGVVVKEAVSASGGLCYSANLAHERIRKAAVKIVDRTDLPAPFSLGAPVTMEVDLNDGEFAEILLEMFPEIMRGDNTVVISDANVLSCWASYWQRKLRCLAVIDTERK